MVAAVLFSASLLTAQSPFPLRISENQRHLVSAQEKPFLIHGDSPWSLFTGYSRADVERLSQ
ncbi:MAG: DUF4038 domain-containing protein [Acidobacteria bacterium]|nr:DUF4038 domain-containing protein [Acidobacteriota bacterium]